MFNITKHTWSDKNTIGCEVFDCDIWLSTPTSLLNTGINKDDAIAIAKHFYDLMTDKEKVDFFYTMNDDAERLDISKSDLCSKHMEPCDCRGVIPQSETTYKSHRLGQVGEMKSNELFNKGDLHG